jgi:GDSL-like Lipase/Acylhydrolase
MNPMISRTLKALCTVAVAALLSACGASSTVSPFAATRVIAFGDGFNFVDGSGAGLSTVQTGETDITIAGRIATRYGIVVKDIGSNPLAATGGFSYATANARVATGANSVDAQITAFLSSAGGVVAKQDLIVIAVGNWDIYDAVRSGATSMDANTTALVAAIQRLTNAGAEHVVVMPPINMSRTPWATTYVTANPAVTRMMIQNLSNSATNSFNFSLLFKLNTAYTQDRKPVAFLDRTTEFNSFAGSVTAEGNAVGNYSGIGFSALGLYTPACTVVAPAAGCALADLAALPGGGSGGALSIDYQTDVFADEINLTPLTNRYLADRMIAVLISFGWAP